MNKPEENNILSFLRSNWLLLAALVYLLFPVDLIPDFIPIVGMGDDSLLLVIEIVRRLVESGNTSKSSNDAKEDEGSKVKTVKNLIEGETKE